MSDNSTNPISREEMEECYKSLSKKRLVKLIVDKTILIRELMEEKEKRVIPSVPKCDRSQLNEGVPERPEPPLSRIIKEGTTGTCPECGSTEKKVRNIPGKRGCINPKCPNYYDKKKKRLL